MTIFLDYDYKCHVVNDGAMRAFEVPFFDGKCRAFIEGYRFVPTGESWTREDGEVFSGEMVAPWKNSAVLMAAQAQYEAMLTEQEDMKTALETLGVRANG